MLEVLRSNNLEIRPFSIEDTDLIYKLSQEKSLAEWVPDQVYEDKEEAREVLEFLISQYSPPINTVEKPLVLAVVLKESGEVIGHVGLSPHKEEDTEIGYAIGESYIGKGYATEAVSLLSQWAISKLNLKSIYGIVASENIGSCRVLEKSSFKKMEEIKMNYLGSNRKCKIYIFTK